MPPLPSYGYGREHPGPRYGSLIHGQNLKDVVITGQFFYSAFLSWIYMIFNENFSVIWPLELVPEQKLIQVSLFAGTTLVLYDLWTKFQSKNSWKYLYLLESLKIFNP